MLPLEDDPGDILRKAMQGRRFTADRLAHASGVPADLITTWTRGEPCRATRSQSDALAHVLDLSPPAFADAIAR
ncbi:MAG: helix-turn-helix domain-containing protein, partial [Vulcanimicrobiaceae bacterium]